MKSISGLRVGFAVRMASSRPNPTSNLELGWAWRATWRLALSGSPLSSLPPLLALPHLPLPAPPPPQYLTLAFIGGISAMSLRGFLRSLRKLLSWVKGAGTASSLVLLLAQVRAGGGGAGGREPGAGPGRGGVGVPCVPTTCCRARGLWCRHCGCQALGLPICLHTQASSLPSRHASRHPPPPAPPTPAGDGLLRGVQPAADPQERAAGVPARHGRGHGWTAGLPVLPQVGGGGRAWLWGGGWERAWRCGGGSLALGLAGRERQVSIRA